jgi:serine/threonine protein phosphatase 1
MQQIRELMDAVGATDEDRIISIGDFIDRGPDSPGCTMFAMEHEALMGNHEFKHVRGIMSRSQVGARGQFTDSLLSYEAAVAYMDTLPFYLELPEAILVHAGLEYGIPMAQQNKFVLVGGMSQRRICGIDKATGLPYWCGRYPKDAKPVIFGHLSMGAGLPVNGNLYPIDTGCVAGRKLTAVTLPDFKAYQVPGWRSGRTI